MPSVSNALQRVGGDVLHVDEPVEFLLEKYAPGSETFTVRFFFRCGIMSRTSR